MNEDVGNLDIRWIPPKTGTLVENFPEFSFDHLRQSPLNPSVAYQGDRTAVIRRAAYAIDCHEEISEDTVKALLSRIVSDLPRNWEEDQKEIPWPDGVKDDMNKSFPSKHRRLKSESKEWGTHTPIHAGEIASFPKDVYDVDDSDALFRVTSKILSSIPEDKRTSVANWMIDLMDSVPPMEMEDYIPQVLKFMNDSNNYEELFGRLMDHFVDRLDKFYVMDESGRMNSDYKYSWVSLEFELFHHEEFIDHLLNEPDAGKAKKLLGWMVFERGFPDIINEVRYSLLDDKKMPDEKKTKFERIGRMLLGINPDNNSIPFHKTIEEFYKSFAIDKYATNEAAEPEELRILLENIASLQKHKKDSSEDIAILDLACGSGRIANALALYKEGQKVKLYGMDKVAANIEKAKAADSTHTVEYKEGDWDHMPYKPESFDRVIGVGRSFCLVKNGQHLEELAKNIHSILKDGGECIFDFPDAEVGDYLENRKQHLQFLKNSGIPMEKYGNEEEQLKHIEHVVDTPDGINLYDRYIPRRESIIKEFERAGFEVEVIGEADIEGKLTGKNIYFKAKKVEPRTAPVPQLYWHSKSKETMPA